VAFIAAVLVLTIAHSDGSTSVERTRALPDAAEVRPAPAVQSAAVKARNIGWHDECYRVLDDPSVVNRYAFESFDQYLEYCVEKKSRGEPLPWARGVLARRVSAEPSGYTAILLM